MKLPKFNFRFSLPKWSLRKLTAEDFAAFKTWCRGLVARLKEQFAAYRAKAAAGSGMSITVRPERVSAWISFVLLLLIVFLATTWILRVARVVFPAQVSSKGVVFYEAASNQRVATLFGEKDFDPSRLVLRGVVITGTLHDANVGVALIEADGKPAETLEVGDMMSPGIRLEKITPDSAVVRYRGRSYELQQSLAGGAGR